MDVLDKIYRNLRKHFNGLPGAVPKTINLVNNAVSKIKLPPITRDTTLYYYLPMQSLVSYTTLSVSVMNPHLMTRLFPKRDITDVLFLSASGGAGLWLWARPHMAAAAPARRFSWAFLGGCLWPLGSIFLWAILRSSVSQRPVLGTILGVATGAMLTNIALDYFHFVELMFCGEVQFPEETYTSNINEDEDEKYDIDL